MKSNTATEQIEQTMLNIRQKANELRHNLERLKFDDSQPQAEKARVFTLASINLHNLQEQMTKLLDNYVLIPDYNIHEDLNTIPNLLGTKLEEEVISEEEFAVNDFLRVSLAVSDWEEMVNRFNVFCHELVRDRFDV